MGYIYKISNIVNNKVYIGQTIKPIKYRWDQHKRSVGVSNNKIHIAMDLIGIENFFIEVIEECDNSKLNEREKYWINYYDSFFNGYNGTLGGAKQTKDDSLSLQAQELWDKGYSITKIAYELNATRMSIRDRIYKYENYSEEEAIKRGTEQAKQEKYKEVYQWDSLGNFIQKYNSLQEASEKTNTNYKALSQALRLNGSSNGYFWTYTKNKPKNLSIQNGIKVGQYDLEGNLIAIYNSRQEAANAVNGDPSSICKCCNGKQKQSKGYIWKNIEERGE